MPPRNALADLAASAPPETPRAQATDAAVLLASVDQGRANELLRLFDQAAAELKPNMGEAMWAIAMLQARILASAEMGEQQIWAAARFAELVQLAFPAMVLKVEQARRQATGAPASDA